MCFAVSVAVVKESLQVAENESKAMGSTLNKDGSEKQVIGKIFSELERAALMLTLTWSDNQAVTK